MFKSWQQLFSLVLTITLVLAPPFISRAAQGDTTRVSLATLEGNDHSYGPAISVDGRYVAFESRAANLVNSDTNGWQDIFLRDTQTGTTIRVSLTTDGTEGDHQSRGPAISADGRYVTFSSFATNLVSGDTNGAWDIFRHDTQTGTTTRVSRASDGTQANGSSYNPVISADGRFVAFQSRATNLVNGDTNGTYDIFLHDTQTGTTTRISRATDGTEGDRESRAPAISADGRFVAFESRATNFVNGDTNETWDIFLHDTQSATTTRVSLAANDTEESDGSSSDPAISADGRFVTFSSDASNLVSGDTNRRDDIFRHDTQTGTTTRVSRATDGTGSNGDSFYPAISGDGRYVVFEADASNLVSGDTNEQSDVFLHDTQNGTTTRVSLGANGEEGNNASSSAVISADGRYVAFESSAANLVNGDTNDQSDVFRYDIQNGGATRVSLASVGTGGDGSSYVPSISGDGRFVAFHSAASNLVLGDTNETWDIFVYDTQNETNTRVSLATDGTESDELSRDPVISADGRFVAFESFATNLVSDDTNEEWDTFIHDTQSATTTRVSVAADGTQGDGYSLSPSLTADGRSVAFESFATNLVSGDTNSAGDIFVRDIQRNTMTRISVASNGTEANSNSYKPVISADGRYVVFESDATNLGDNDTNGACDVFLHDTQRGTTTRVSRASDGMEGNSSSSAPDISADGRFVVFSSDATNLVSGDTNGTWDIFVHNTQTGTTTRVSRASDGAEGDDLSRAPAISADGRYVAFASFATNLVNGDTNGTWDIFVHDTQTGTITRVSRAADGTQGDDLSRAPTISADGRYVAFASAASNFAENDTNGEQDIFLHEPDFVPAVVSITRTDPDPTTAARVGFTVTFSEDVTGLDESDFVLTTTGTLSDTSIIAVSGTGATYTVIVATGTGDGTLRLDIPASATLTDTTGNALAGLSYTNGEIYTVLAESNEPVNDPVNEPVNDLSIVYLPMIVRNAP